MYWFGALVPKESLSPFVSSDLRGPAERPSLRLKRIGLGMEMVQLCAISEGRNPSFH